MGTKTIHTIGHSTRSADEFITLLEAACVKLLADVRAYPASRRHPQFGREALADALKARGIGYTWLGAALGGHREARSDTPNTGLAPVWRGYADHTATPRYRAGIEQLEALAGAQGVACMCAERDPADCHRNLISDTLVNRGWNVTHLIGADERRAHRLNPAARPADGGLVYPGADQQQMGLF